MERLLLLLSFCLVCQTLTYGQRSTRRLKPASSVAYTDTFAGRHFNATLTNNDTTPALLRLGGYKKIENNDTLNLTRTCHCGNTTIGEHYDLDNIANQITSCVNWYSLQLIKPKDTLHFVIDLIDLDRADTARLYFDFTREITKLDRELNLYTEPQKTYIMKEERAFKSSYVTIDKNATHIALSIDRVANKQ